MHSIISLTICNKTILAAVGFEPTPPKRLVPKTSALDRSATLPITFSQITHYIYLENLFNYTINEYYNECISVQLYKRINVVYTYIAIKNKKL